MNNQNHPKVFISYSWDDEKHKKWVLGLANQLVAYGVDVILDQYDLQLGRNLTYFMERAVQEADKVILIMTENFKIKAEGRKGGVGYEYSMINAAWYNNQTENTKFIPVLRGIDRALSMPIFVNSFIDLDMRDDAQWDKNLEELLRTIYNAPKVVKPPLGKRPDFANTTNEINLNTNLPASINTTDNEVNNQHFTNKKEKISNYIVNNDFKSAFELLENLVKGTRQESDVILLQSRYNQYKTNERSGTHSNSELSRTRNRLVYNLLSLLDSIEL